jgi:hypothetical protein
LALGFVGAVLVGTACGFNTGAAEVGRDKGMGLFGGTGKAGDALAVEPLGGTVVFIAARGGAGDGAGLGGADGWSTGAGDGAGRVGAGGCRRVKPFAGVGATDGG